MSYSIYPAVYPEVGVGFSFPFSFSVPSFQPNKSPCFYFLSLQVPFGIAQVGKAFRNEITPRNFIFRSREFEQMEVEYFVEEGDAWKQVRQ